MPLPSLRRRPSASMVVATVALIVAASGGAFAASKAINGNTILAGTVGSSKLANGAVTTPKIKAGAVGAKQIRDLSITGLEIAKGTITPDKLSAPAAGATTVTRFVTSVIPINTIQSIVATCQPGEKVVSGGYSGVPNTVGPGGTQADVTVSRPDPVVQGAPVTGWFAQLDNFSTTQAQFTVYVLCAQGA